MSQNSQLLNDYLEAEQRSGYRYHDAGTFNTQYSVGNTPEVPRSPKRRNTQPSVTLTGVFPNSQPPIDPVPPVDPVPPIQNQPEPSAADLLINLSQDQQAQDEQAGEVAPLPVLDVGHVLIVKNGLNQFAQELAGNIQFQVDQQSEFHIKKILGQGTFATTYAISPVSGYINVQGEEEEEEGDYDKEDQVPAKGFPRDYPQYAAKVFDKKPDQDQKDFDTMVEAEYRLSSVIANRLKIKGPHSEATKHMAINDVALAKWEVNCDPVDGMRRRRAIIFPFFDSMNLEEFLRTKLDKMRREKLRKGMKELWRVQAYRLCSIICKKFAKLHQLGIYHRDIRLENIVIQNIDPRVVQITNNMVRIIDFGNGCALDVFNQLLTPDYRLTSCSFPGSPPVALYQPTRLYADPRTYVNIDYSGPVQPPGFLTNITKEGDKRRFLAFPITKLETLWPAFEAYSVAVCIQLIFDSKQRRYLREQYAANNPASIIFQVPEINGGKDPIIAPPRQSEPLLAMLLALSGNDDSRRDLSLASKEFDRLESRFLECFKVPRNALEEYIRDRIMPWSIRMNTYPNPQFPQSAFFEPDSFLEDRLLDAWLRSKTPALIQLPPAARDCTNQSVASREKNTGLFENRDFVRGGHGTTRGRPKRPIGDDDDNENDDDENVAAE